MNKMPPYKLYRRFMTLLELMIGLGLTVFLLAVMSYFYQQVIALDAKSEQMEKEAFQRQYLESRLQSVFTQILPEYRIKNHKLKHFYFFTSNDLGGLLAQGSPSLLFVYNSEANMDHEIAQYALTRLYLDQKNRLCLASWPIPDKWVLSNPPFPRKEILFEGVEKIDFLFYSSSDQDRTFLKNKLTKSKLDMHVPAIETPHQNDWIPEWKQGYDHLPPMVKIILTLTKKDADQQPVKLTLAYPLSHSSQVVIYE